MERTDYLRELGTLLERTYPELTRRHRLEFKNCFGAVAGYADATIFISCGRFGVALRLPVNVLHDLFTEPDVTRLTYFPNGHVKKEYAVLPARILNDRDRFRELVEMSIKHSHSR